MIGALHHQRLSGGIVIICFGFQSCRLRRQPWAAAHGMAEGFAAWGKRVTIITDDEEVPASTAYGVVTLAELFKRGRPCEGLRRSIEGLDPDAVFCFTGAWQLARARDFGWRARTWLVMASPRLRLAELLSPGWRLVWQERSVLTLPLLNALLPGWLLSAGFKRSRAENIVYLSGETQTRYQALGLPVGSRMRPQVRSFVARPALNSGALPKVVYLGPPLEMRGAYLALESFEQAAARGARAQLQLLLRPDGSADLMRRFLDRVEQSSFRHLIAYETEMLSVDRLNDLVSDADVFLLPFRAPVSEVPLVVLEAGLSGRPVIVLAAPGVSEYAEELGGIVAETPAHLPDALLHALRHGLSRKPEPSRWNGWRDSVRGLVSYPRTRLNDYGMIALCGADGSGKTHLLNFFKMELQARGQSSVHVWSRFRNYLSKPLLALARLTGHNRKEMAGGQPVGYHDFQTARWLAWPFLVLQIIDNWLDIKWRFRQPKGSLIVADRCIVDTLVDWAVDTGLDDFIIDQVGPRLLRLLPGPRLIVVVERPAALVAADRPDAFAERHFARRRALFARIAAAYNLPVIENDGLAEDAVDQIVALIHTDEAHAWDQDHDLRLLQQ